MKTKIIQILTIFILLTSQKTYTSEEYVFFLCDKYPHWEVSARLGITPLHCVTTIEEAKNLMKSGCDINARDNDLLTPMQYMMYHDRRNIAVYLFSHGAKLSRKDHIRIDAIIHNKQSFPKDVHAYVSDNFHDQITSHIEKNDHLNKKAFTKSSTITYKILKSLKNEPISPVSITSRHRPSPDIIIPKDIK